MRTELNMDSMAMSALKLLFRRSLFVYRLEKRCVAEGLTGLMGSAFRTMGQALSE